MRWGTRFYSTVFWLSRSEKGFGIQQSHQTVQTKITWLAASRQHLQWQIWLALVNVADRQRVSPPITLDLFLPSLLQTLPLGSLPLPDAWDKSRRFRGNLPSVAAGYIKTLDRPAFSCRRESAPCPFRPGFIDGPWCMRRRSGRSCKTHSAAVLWLCFAPQLHKWLL